MACWGFAELGGDVSSELPLGAITAISVGDSHFCGLGPDGAAACWPSDETGGAGTPGGVFASISAGGVHTCGLRPGGAVECWGSGPEVVVRTLAEDVADPGGVFASVSAGYGHACGLRPDARIDCWGRNWFGQADAPPGRFVAVDAGAGPPCGLRDDGTIDCWGRDSLRAANLMSESYKYGGSDRTVPPNPGAADGETVRGAPLHRDVARRSANWEPPPGPYVAVSAGHGFTCGLRLDGAVACWGHLNEHELRAPLHVLAEVRGTEIMDIYTERTAALKPIERSSAGLYAGVSLFVEEYQLEYARAIVELPNPPPGRFLAVDAGWLRACGLRPDATIECWGSNHTGAASPPPGPFAVTPITDEATTDEGASSDQRPSAVSAATMSCRAVPAMTSCRVRRRRGGFRGRQIRPYLRGAWAVPVGGGALGPRACRAAGGGARGDGEAGRRLGAAAGAVHGDQLRRQGGENVEEEAAAPRGPVAAISSGAGFTWGLRVEDIVVSAPIGGVKLNAHSTDRLAND